MDKGQLFGGKKGKDASSEPPAANAKELMEELEQLEKDINELRSQYELFFMGVERVEPKPARDLIRSSLRRFKETPNLSTVVKFKFQMLQARIISFEVAIDETVQFGALQLTPRVCWTRPPTEAPQTDAFVEVDEVTVKNEYRRIFTG